MTVLAFPRDSMSFTVQCSDDIPMIILATQEETRCVGKSGGTVDLVLIDPQSVGKRTHDLMDTVNAKEMEDHLLACQYLK
jgi:hypothetical protein